MRFTPGFRTIGAAAICSWLILPYRCALAGSFAGLGDLAGGTFESYASRISLDGSTVVGQGRSALGQEAFRWTAATGMVGLGDLAGSDYYSAAFGVSANGAVVVGQGTSLDGEEAFRWTSAGGMQGLGDLSGDIFASFAVSTNANGSVVVGAGYGDNGQEGFRWTAASGMQGISALIGAGSQSVAYAVSSDGAVLAGDEGKGARAFRWTAGTGYTLLATPNMGSFVTNVQISARALTPDGLHVIGTESGFDTRRGGGDTQEAVLWDPGVNPKLLGDLPGGGTALFSGANDISADGSIVVGYGTTDNGNEAFIWDAVHGMRNLRDVLVNDLGLDLTGWTLTSAEGISGLGTTVVGWGTNPNGDTEAWIAEIPEPAGVWMLGAALFLARRRGRM